MVAVRLPGPVCKFLGSYDIDAGTLCRATSPVPRSGGLDRLERTPAALGHDQDAKRLLDTIRAVVAMKDVQPGYPDANGRTDTTWCNRAANRILTTIGYDTSALLNLNKSSGKPDIGYTGANAMATNAKSAARNRASGVKEVSEEEARSLARAGVPVLAVATNSSGHGHVGIVAPNDGDVTKIGQAGSRNGVFSVGSAFGSLSPSVHYYALPEKSKSGGGGW